MNSRKQLKKEWLIYSSAGLILIGFGACLIAEAAMMKYADANTWKWVLYGTIALSVFNAGLSIFGTGIVRRSQLEKNSKCTDK